ncbi:MAG TPA: peptidase [Thermoplasmata archaeon]|nr:peptidase [Thermoplasmata archaeon]
MKNSSSKLFSIEIFYHQVNEEVVQVVENALTNEYSDVLNVIVGGELALPGGTYDPSRRQYNAEGLLRYLLSRRNVDIMLWVVGEDLYVPGMNFVFGYAMYYKGAVLSIYRLPSWELMGKEAVHEVGHVLGLKHCRNRCVMRFSNTLWEAKMKPSHLCMSCKRKIKSLKGC